MQVKKQKPRFYTVTVHIYESGDVMRSTHSTRQILTFLRSIDWQNRDLAITLKVYYGTSLDVWGDRAKFCNEAFYQADGSSDLLSRKFWIAFNAFSEKE